MKRTCILLLALLVGLALPGILFADVGPTPMLELTELPFALDVTRATNVPIADLYAIATVALALIECDVATSLALVTYPERAAEDFDCRRAEDLVDQELTLRPKHPRHPARS